MPRLRHSILVVLLPFVLVAPTAVLAQTPAAELRLAEEQLARALIHDDTATFERLLAADFVLRGAPDVDRAAWIKNAIDLCWGASFELTDFTVRRQTDDAAIVSLIMTTPVDPVTCDPATIRSLLTDVWVRQPDGWRLVLRHAGPAGDVAKQFTRIDPPPPLWERAVDMSLVSTGGNTDTRTFGIGGALVWRPDGWVTRARAAYARSSTDGLDTAESLTADLRQSHALSKRLDVRAGATYLVDRFAGIDHRTTVDGGIGWLAVDAAPHTLKLDVGAGVTHESRIAADDLTFPAGTLDVQYRWRFSRTSDLTEQLVFSTDLGSFGNWRLRNVANVTVTMTRLLSLRFGHELRRNNRPVPGFGTTDTMLSAAFVLRF